MESLERVKIDLEERSDSGIFKRPKKGGLAHRVGNIVGVVLCVILLPVLILNVTLIVRSYVNTEQVPSISGYLPLIVLTDSMYPGIQSGDLIICHTAEPETVAVGDVIAFYDPAGNGSSIVTHRVTEITEAEGTLAFRTKGDANDAADAALVPAGSLVGVYERRIPGAGNVAMFMQTTAGLVLCVALPMLLLLAYDMIRRRVYEKNYREDTEALRAELEALRAQANKN